MIINLIQDIPTPHNNVLIKELVKDSGIELKLWYAARSHNQYGWSKDLSDEIIKSNIYGYDKVSWDLVRYALKNRDEKYIIIGWGNPTTRALVLVLWLLRRPFNIWTDLPNDNLKRNIAKKIIREFYYFMLKTSRTKIFCVGKSTIEYFLKRGFSENRLLNLPIFIDIDKIREDYGFNRDGIKKKYCIYDGDLFLLSGSRLIHEKGFDLLIEAISLLPQNKKSKVKAVIVGKGEEKENLLELISRYKLKSNIFIEEWMDIEDFKACIANSDFFIHPARFDAYGNTIYAMGLGTPVIGSFQAGAANDLVINGVNGFLYNSEETGELARLIEYVFDNRELLKGMSSEAVKASKKLSPVNGVITIKEGLI